MFVQTWDWAGFPSLWGEEEPSHGEPERSGEGGELGDVDDALATRGVGLLDGGQPGSGHRASESLGDLGGGRNTYGYDDANRLTSWTKPDTTTVAYGWDAAGNLTNNGGVTTTFDQRNRILASGNTSYTWSPRGTLLETSTGGVPITYASDALDRAITADGVNYTYDAFDRVATSGGTDFSYAGTELDPAQIDTLRIARTPSGNPVATKLGALPGSLVGRNRHGDIGYQYQADGTLVGTRTFDPLGATIAQTGAALPLGFQGDYTAASGDVWMGARWYRPGTGTFLSHDTVFGHLETPFSLNRYTYAWANPLGMFDPDGHEPCSWCNSTQAGWQNVAQQAAANPNQSITIPRDLLFPKPEARQNADAGSEDWCQASNGCFSMAAFEADPDGFADGTSGSAFLARAGHSLDNFAVAMMQMALQANPVYNAYLAASGTDPTTGEHLSWGARGKNAFLAVQALIPAAVEWGVSRAFSRGAATIAEEASVMAVLEEGVGASASVVEASSLAGVEAASAMDGIATTASEAISGTSELIDEGSDLAKLTAITDAAPGSVATEAGGARFAVDGSGTATDLGPRVAPGRPVVIGEGMQGRVIPAAERMGADVYQPPQLEVPTQQMAHNKYWVNEQMNQGRGIIDIGPAPGRVNYPEVTSEFFGMEHAEIAARSYPYYVQRI